MQKSATIALISNNKLLLLRRGQSAPWMPGRYCLPGGKLEKNESLIHCALRELNEETGIVLNETLIPVTINYNNFYSKIVYTLISKNDFHVNLNWEHDNYVWSSYSESSNISLVTSLPTTIKYLYNNGFLT